MAVPVNSEEEIHEITVTKRTVTTEHSHGRESISEEAYFTCTCGFTGKVLYSNEKTNRAFIDRHKFNMVLKKLNLRFEVKEL